jgi:hypothetical protein
MNKHQILRIGLIISVAILLGSAAAISRDYQDSWILEGLEIPFLLFIVFFVLTFFSEKKVSSLISLAILGRVVWLLIPNLKYVWFQGVAQDQHVQYGLASYLVNTGTIATNVPFTSGSYIATPLLQILLSVFSVVLGVSVVDSIKYVPILFSPIYPLLTYAIVKKMGSEQESNILKYALFLASIPISGAGFLIGGITFGILLAFIVLFLLVAVIRTNDRRYSLLLPVFLIALAAAHSPTSIILTGLVLLTITLQRVPWLRQKFHIRTSVALIFGSISLAWLGFPGYFNFDAIIRGFFILLPEGATPGGDQVPSTFLQLIRVEPLAAGVTFLVFYGAIALFMVLTCVGLIIMLRKWKKLDGVSSLLVSILGLTLVTMMVGVFIQLGPFRALSFVEILFPFLCAAAIFYLGKRRRWLRPLVLVSIILVATLSIYGCQPLIPSANIIFEGLPSSVPVGYRNNVNSIYQRLVVNFVLRYGTTGVIACDEVTYNQMAYFVENYSFTSSHVIHYWPIGTRQPQREYDMLIVHYPGKAGIMGETADVRSPDLISQIIANSSVVYTNGESYILLNYPQP